MQTAQPVNYATTGLLPRSYWPEAILAFMGLGLVALGGCFLIGIASVYDIFMLNPSVNAGPKTPGQVVFVVVLYVCSALCMLGAVLTLGIAVKRLVSK